MVPDCHRRLVAARADLEKSIAELEPDFGGDPQKEEEPDENLVAAKQVRDHPYTTFDKLMPLFMLELQCGFKYFGFTSCHWKFRISLTNNWMGT